MENHREFRVKPEYADTNESFDEFLIASGIGKTVWKISDVCVITTDHAGRRLQYVEIEDEFEDD